MPEIFVKQKWAWKPTLTTSGKWLWCRNYIQRTNVYWGPAGFEPVIDIERYTEGEWFLEQIKDSVKNRPPPPKPTKVKGP